MINENLVRADHYPETKKYIVFVCGYSIDLKESFPEVANSIARQVGQKSYEETTYTNDAPPKTVTVEVY